MKIYADIPKLKLCRVKNGMSARSLAIKASLNAATVAGIEKTGRSVAPSTAKAICDVLGVPFDALFTMEDEANGKEEV